MCISELQGVPRERNHGQNLVIADEEETCEISKPTQRIIIIHDILAEYMFKSLQPPSVLCPATIRCNNCCTTPWHGLDEYLHHLHPLTIPYFLQYLAIEISHFHTLRWMSEQLLKALVKACLEVCPQVFDGI